MNMNNCNECIHSKVCRLKNVCERISKRLDNSLDITTDEKESFEVGQFEVKLHCKDFELAIPTIRGISEDKISYDGPGLELFGKSNPCIDCDWYKTYVLGGKIYIGDTPCNWCSKRQPYCSDRTATVVSTSGEKNND